MASRLHTLDNGGSKEEPYEVYKYDCEQGQTPGRSLEVEQGGIPSSPSGKAGTLLPPTCRGSLTSEDDDFTSTLKNIKSEEGVVGKQRASLGPCKVCGDEATGMYFGALVCVPCKTFFLRYAGDNFAFVCKHDKNCEITMTTRTQCKYCRYQKCLQAGMCRRERPAQVQLSEGQQLCVVCKDIANGVHFGAITCEGCKKFFRRGLTEHNTYSCKNDEKCLINPRTRNSCRYCRFKKCLEAGMSREAIQMGRPSKIKHSNSTDQDQSDTKMPRLDMENSSVDMSSDIAERRSREGASRSEQTANVSPGGDLLGAASRHYSQHSQLSPPLGRHPNPSATHPDMALEYRGLYDSTNRNNSSATMSHPPVSPQSRYRGEAGRPDTHLLIQVPESPAHNPSPQSDLQAASPAQSLSPMSPPTSTPQPRVNPIPFNLFPTPSPGSDVRFHGPAKPKKVDPDSVNAAHLIEQIISQSTFESPPNTTAPGGVDSRMSTLPSLSQANNAGTSEQSHAVLESVAPAMPMALAFQNIKQEFARVALSMYPPVTQIKSSSVSATATMSSLNIPTSDPMPSPDTTGAGLPSRSSSSHSVASTSLLHSPVSTSRAQPNGEGERRPPTVSNSVLSSLFELSEQLQGLKQGPGSLAIKKEGEGGEEGASGGHHDSAARTLHHLTDSESTLVEFDFKMCVNYWLRPELPDENLLFSEDHWRIIDQIMPAYNRFVETGSSINRKLANEVKNWSEIHHQDKIPQEWINAKVVPVYTLSSVTFSRDLPDFNTFEIADQCTLVRLGQSQSRILVAAVHWYDPDLRDFRDFLAWRKIDASCPDFFKRQLVEYARVVHSLELDNIEAGLLNVLVIIAKDYPGLQKTDLIEQARSKILLTFRAYTTAKYGTPNRRIETLFSHIPELRQLGFMHHRMTLELQLKAEECIEGQR